MSWRPRRLRIAKALARNGFTCSNDTRPWRDTIELYLRHRFVLCASGNGHNDFRYWEVLNAGAVPVIERNDEQDELWRGLPVVRVSDWSELTPALLDGEWARIQREVRTGALSWAKVYLPFWLHAHTAHLDPPRGEELMSNAMRPPSLAGSLRDFRTHIGEMKGD